MTLKNHKTAQSDITTQTLETATQIAYTYAKAIQILARARTEITDEQLLKRLQEQAQKPPKQATQRAKQIDQEEQLQLSLNTTNKPKIKVKGVRSAIAATLMFLGLTGIVEVAGTAQAQVQISLGSIQLKAEVQMQGKLGKSNTPKRTPGPQKPIKRPAAKRAMVKPAPRKAAKKAQAKRASKT